MTSPRFFSARHGSVEDVRTATAWIRTYVKPTSLCAIGWSNSGTIVCNALSEPDSLIDAACCLAAPLDMPSSSANFERPFHRNVYDRAIGGSLAEKFRTAQHLFVDADGPKPVPAYFGGDFVADVEKASGIAARIESGQVWVNQHIAIGPHIPMAGFKNSGLGVEQASEGLAEYTQLQVINVKR